MLPDLPPMPHVEIDPLPYEQKLDARPLSQIDLVVVHCTETPTLASAREFGERVLYEASGTGNSGHYYIDRDGRIARLPDGIAVSGAAYAEAVQLVRALCERDGEVTAVDSVVLPHRAAG